MIMAKMTLRVLAILTIFLGGCKDSKELPLKSGDLLFRSQTPSLLSQAIDDVTETGNGKHFSHIGIVDIKKDRISVIHAEGGKGVCKEPLDSFMTDERGDLMHADVYRLKPEYQPEIENALNRARSVIGEPYNYSYIVEDSGFYCSELVWWAFLPDSLFQLKPMTFKDSNTGKFHEGWIKYYMKLGIEIPEGKLGCNPNGMATSDKIYFLQTFDN
jgi:hypothetical protein